jgi:hypothetical protein
MAKTFTERAMVNESASSLTVPSVNTLLLKMSGHAHDRSMLKLARLAN